MRSKKQENIDIDDFYSIKLRSIWNGLKQEGAAFWWLCIYMFFEYVRPQSLYPQIDVIPWSQICLTILIITAFFDQSVKWVKNSGNALILLFYCIVLLSSLLAFRPSTSWSELEIITNWVILYFLIITVVNTEKRFFLFILLFMLVSFKMSQHGFMTFAGRGFSFRGWGATGSPGWFRNSGEFAIQMVIFAPLAIAFILPLKKYWGRYKRWFFYLFPITALISIIASSSRGSQIAIIMVGLWYLFKSRLGLKGVMGVLIIGGVLYLLLPSEQIARFEVVGDDNSSLQRFAYWDHGVNVILDHPIIGVGYANWKDYCWFRNPEGVGPGQLCQESHNIYIQGASELGLAGLVVYILMAILVFKLNAKTRIHAKLSGKPLLGYIAYGLDGGMIGFLVAGFFVTVLYYPFFWVQMAMVVALYAISTNLTNVKNTMV